MAHLAGGFSLPNAVAAAWVMNGKRRVSKSRENCLGVLLQGFLSRIALGDQGRNQSVWRVAPPVCGGLAPPLLAESIINEARPMTDMGGELSVRFVGKKREKQSLIIFDFDQVKSALNEG